MAGFQECLAFALEESKLLAPDSNLKPKQLETLESVFNERDTIAVLPTGYGTHGMAFEDDELCNNITTDVPYNELERGQWNLLYVHPETFESKKFGGLLRSGIYQNGVCAVVIDEVHMISEWGEEFRPAFRKLGDVTALFNNAVHLAMTATATPRSINDLSTILHYQNPSIISTNPDRPNIYIDIRKRLPNNKKIDKYDDLVGPLAGELKEKQMDFPLTIMYVESLESLGYFYQYFSYELRGCSYIGEQKPENRIFAQYHKDYPTSMKHIIINELLKTNPKLRFVMATVALGMGLNAPSVRRIIHCRPPTTIEKYLQEMGRAGRDGAPSISIMYYNNSDICKSRKGLLLAMREFCLLENKCYRKMLMNYLGFGSVVLTCEPINCCSNCRNLCE